MNNTRRKFLKTLSVGTLLSQVGVQWLSAADKRQISLQLYSLRDDMGKQPVKTIELVAKAGYKLVEHAGYGKGKFYGMTPKDFKKLLSDNGLNMPSGHTVLGPEHLDKKGGFTAEWKKTVEDAAFLGQKYVISPWLSEEAHKDTATLKKFMEHFNKAGELCQQMGMKFGYHNHDFEMGKLPDGKIIYDVMLQNTDAKLVTMQMDVAWVTAPGSDPLVWFNKYPGRFELLHMKDLVRTNKATEKYRSVELGDGIVKFDAILKNAAKAGAKYFVVEQEDYGTKKPIECVTIDYQRLSKMMS
jgi:sugar phosphate isomerase/epimerase